MLPLVELAVTPERCSPFRQGFDADPIGSAGAYDAFLCIEVPLPWQKDISLSEPFVSLGDRRKPFASLSGRDGRVWRPQGLVPGAVGPSGAGTTSELQPNAVRVIAFEKEFSLQAEPANEQSLRAEQAAPFTRREWLLCTGEVLPLAQALLNADETGIATYEQFRVQVPATVIDLLICTHGKRDVCCGQSGMALYSEVASRLAEVTASAAPAVHGGAAEVRVWRASHTGGHRFAPTALTFPDGYAWAYLDAKITEQILQRSTGLSEPGLLGGRGPGTSSDLSVAAQHCRGLSTLTAGPAQAADRAGLLKVGWAWATAHRTVQILGFDRQSLATTLQITGRIPDGQTRSFRVEVELERHIPQITCGAIDAPEYQVEAVWKVASATEV